MTNKEDLGKIHDIRIVKRLAKYIKPYKFIITIAVLFSLLHTGVYLLLPWLTKIAIDDYILLSNPQGLKKIVSIYFMLIIAGSLFSFGMMYLMQLTGQLVIRDIRIQTFSHLQRLRISFFDRTPIGRIVTRVTNDGEAMNHFFSEVIVRVFTNTFMLIGVVIVMLKLNLKLSLITFTVLPPLIFVMNLFRIKVRAVYRKVRNLLAKINTHLNETFTGIKVIQLFAQQGKNYQKFGDVNHKYYQATMQQIIVYGIFMPLTDLFLSCGIALIIWHGGGSVIQGILSLGTLVAFLSYLQMFFQPIREISQQFDTMQSSFSATERIFKLLDTQEFEPAPQRIDASPLTHIKQLRGEIEFKNVWFSYEVKSGSPKSTLKGRCDDVIAPYHRYLSHRTGGSPRSGSPHSGEKLKIEMENKEWVLEDISFCVNPGEKIAIVGPTGAGKTSLINLLTQFYEPQKGEILVDHTPIQNFDRSFLRTNIAVVSQDDFIFSGTIKDNIRLRNSELSDTTIKQVAEFVNAHRFIQRLPQGYNQQVKEHGSNLSYGELQLLSFARALATNPKVLILDEATREVDSETEKLIQDAISRLLKGRTSIVIAHRLSTIKNVDRIIVLHRRKIIEQGTHPELLNKGGAYKTLYEFQYK